MNEMATLQNASVYNQVYPVQKPDYSKEVTEASNIAFVLVLLTSSTGTNVESQLMIELWRELARNFGEIKFCQMQANLCIEGYPDKNTPTVLAYKDGEIKRQLVTLKELNGTSTSLEGMPRRLPRCFVRRQTNPGSQTLRKSSSPSAPFDTTTSA